MLGLLAWQVFGAAFAAIVFRLGLEPRMAGLMGGAVFVGVGIHGARIGWAERRRGVLVYVVFLMAIVHILGIALPMLGYRIMHWDEPFSKIAVWGLSGPDFHSLSTRLYGLWMLFTAAAWWNHRKS